MFLFTVGVLMVLSFAGSLVFFSMLVEVIEIIFLHMACNLYQNISKGANNVSPFKFNQTRSIICMLWMFVKLFMSVKCMYANPLYTYGFFLLV